MLWCFACIVYTFACVCNKCARINAHLFALSDTLQALCQVTQGGQLFQHNFTPAPGMEDVDSEDSDGWRRKYPGHCEGMDPPTATYHSFALPVTTPATVGRPPVPVKRTHRSKAHGTRSPHVAPPSAGTRSSQKATAQASGGSVALVAPPSTGKRSAPQAESDEPGTGWGGTGSNSAKANQQTRGPGGQFGLSTKKMPGHAERGESCANCRLLAEQIKELKKQVQNCQKKRYFGV